MEPSPTRPAHALEPDLAVIRELAGRTPHDRAFEARRALAVYERVCWRLALVAFPEPALGRVLALEGDAARLLRRYVAGEVSPARLWSEFEALVVALDAFTAGVAAGAQDALDAGQALRVLRVRVAEAGLPTTVRLEVQHLLDVTAEALVGLQKGKLDTASFWSLFRQGESAVSEALAAASHMAPGTAEARLNRACADVARRLPPVVVRPAIARALSALVADWQAGRPLEVAALDELDSMLARGERFRASWGEAASRLEAREAAIGRHPLAPPLAIEGEALLETLHGLLSGLEAGRLEPDEFEARFEAAWARLDELVRLSDDGPVALGEAVRLGDRAHARVAEASLPRFVRHTARELLERLDVMLDEQRADPLPPEGFSTACRDVLLDLEVTLALGREVVSEKTEALRRYEALEARVAGRHLAPMLRGPVADLLETLRELLHRLDAGLFPLTSFHRVFDEAAGRLDQLLAWQAVLDASHPEQGGAPCAAS